MKIEVNTLSFS